MIVYKVSFSEDNILFNCMGHAYGGIRDREGNNLVCAIVSAIAQTCAAGCSRYADLYQEEAWDVSKGHLAFSCSNNLQTKAIVEAALIGLEEAARQYPKQVQKGVV